MESRQHYAESLQIVQALPHPEGVAQCQRGIAYACVGQSDFREARKWFEESLATYRRIGQVAEIGERWEDLGDLEFGLGNYDAALAHYDKAQEIFHAMGDALAESAQLNNKGDVWEERKDHRQALALYRQSLDLKHSIGNVLRTVTTLTAIGRQHMFLANCAKPKSR
jgi:tetratricopeptide (TPR) repeat protein